MELSSEAFNKLLSCLDDPDRTGENYTRLRYRLTLFFEGRQSGLESQALADETLDILARKLLEGSVGCSSREVVSYSFGIAKNLAKHGAPKTVPAVPDPPAPIIEVNDTEKRHDCLERCLERLFPPETRGLIREYYRGEGGEKIEKRKQFAQSLRITMNALRKRVHAVMNTLAPCVRNCVDEESEG